MKWVYKKDDLSFGFIKSDSKPNNNAQVMDASLWLENEDYLVVSESTETDSNGNEYQKYNVSLDQGTKDAGEAQKLAEKNSLESFAALNSEVSVDAAQTAGTSNQLSAIFDVLTYKRMQEKPELFDSEGLVTKQNTLTFSKGDALDTILKITTYANEMLSSTDAFMIRRLKKITNYILGV